MIDCRSEVLICGHIFFQKRKKEHINITFRYLTDTFIQIKFQILPELEDMSTFNSLPKF